MVTTDTAARYSKGSITLGATSPKIETGPASEKSFFFKEVEDGQSPKKRRLYQLIFFSCSVLFPST
jgi:hypothetical protein